MLNKRHFLLTVSAFVVAGASGEALAGGFALREQSAYYQGMSFAGTAAGGDSISSMFWNPATVTNTIGLVSESHHTLIIPDATIYPDATTQGTISFIGGDPSDSGEMANDAWLPAGYFGYNVNDKIYLGLGVNGPFGLATKAGPEWAGQVYARTSEVFSLNANPIVGYKFNDQLSVAVGLQIQYFDVRLTSALAPTVGAPTGELTGDDVGVGVTAGVTYSPMPGTDLGLGYRSTVSHKLEGDFKAGGVTTPVEAELMTPDMVTFSAKQRITDQFRLMGTIEWTNWSRLKTPRAVAKASGATVTTLPFNYDDGWFFSLGGEYDWNDALTLRAGVGYEISPIDTDIRSLRLPDDDRVWLSAGLSYQPMENLTLDLGYSYLFTTSDPDLDITSGHQDWAGLDFTGHAESSVNIVSAALRYRW